MHTKTGIIGLLLVFSTVLLKAQVAWIEPSGATVDSAVTVYFDATGGDQGLMDFEGDVYAHTGVITLESDNGGDWKHVVADWGSSSEEVRMQQEEANLYSLSFHIRDFYGIQPGETVLSLAFVFRNADGSESARSEDGSDVYVPLENDIDWEYRYFTNTEAGLKVMTSKGYLHFVPYNGAVKTIIMPDSSETSGSYAVEANPVNQPFAVDTSATMLYASWQDFEVHIEKESLQVTYLYNDTLTILDAFYPAGPGQGGLLDFSLHTDMPVYGGGSRALPFNLRGEKLEFYNQAHYGYSAHTPNLNISIPLLATSRHFAWLFDNRYRASADIGRAKANQMQYRTEEGPLRFFLLGAGSMQTLSETTSNLTGNAPLPPLWGLGYIQSRYGYQTRDEAEQVVTDMRAQDFAMDALVLDLYWFGGTSHMGDFNWDRNNFPEPGGMIAGFAEKGIETILITEPYFTLQSDLYDEAASKGYFATNEQGNPYVLYGFWAGDASLFDMTSADARNWLWPKYQALFEMGVSGLWTDLGEPETHPEDMQHEQGLAGEVHNIYNNLWAKMLHERTHEAYPQKRLFNLTRSGYTGMQRYGTYPWSGDIQRSFEGLQAQIPIMLHMAMSGIGYMHSDLGGFTGGGQNGELYGRWLQLGTFTPVMRAHGTGVPPEPIYYDSATKDIVRQAIDLRYRFLPYNYTLAWKYSSKGIPPARPVNYYASDTATALAAISDQYLWGRDLLVAPVLHEGATSRLVTFPQGKWAHYETGNLYEGRTTSTVAAPRSDIPLFIRQGGFLVQTREDLLHTKAYNSDSIRIRHVIPAKGENTTRHWYHDDGQTAGNLAANRYNLMEMQSAHEEDRITLSLEKQTANLNSPERQIEYMVYGLTEAPGMVRLNGHRMPVTSDQQVYRETQKAAYWEAPFLYLHFPWRDTLAEVQIRPEGATALQKQQRQKGLKVHATPNPFVRNPVIDAMVQHPGTYNAAVFRLDGGRLGEQRFHWKQGRHVVHLSDIVPGVDAMPAGMYLLVLQGPQTRTQTRLIKQSGAAGDGMR